MIRAQIQFSEVVHRDIKRVAAERGVSISEVVRRAVQAYLAIEAAAPSRDTLVREAAAVAGMYSDPEGRDDVAVHHDDHLDGAYGR